MRLIRAICSFGVLILMAGCSESANPISPSPLSSAPPSLFAQAGAARTVGWTEVVGLRTTAPLAAAADAPGTPASLTGSAVGSTVTLTWMAPASGSPTSYVIEAGSAPGQSNIANFDTGTTATSFNTTGVPDGTYYVRVRARNADGAGGPSNEVTLVVGSTGGCTMPAAPAGFAATASGATVTLSWTAVPGAQAYIVEAGTMSGSPNLTTFETGTATTFSGSAPNGTYYLRVRVRTACGTSAASNEAVLTVDGTTPPPPGASLAGTWAGTIAGRLSGTQTADFTQSGTSATGVLRNRSAGQSITFRLTQTDATTYSGTLTFEGTGGGACGAGNAAGSVTIASGPPATMTGTFTLPPSGACPALEYSVIFTRQ